MDEGPGLGLKRRKRVVEQKESNRCFFTIIEEFFSRRASSDARAVVCLLTALKAQIY